MTQISLDFLKFYSQFFFKFQKCILDFNNAKHSVLFYFYIFFGIKSIILKFREIVHEKFQKCREKHNSFPTLKSIQRSLQDIPEFENWSIYKVHKVLLQMGFKFQLRSHVNTALLIEDPYIVSCRKLYIRKIRQYRANSHGIYFCDETWVNILIFDNSKLNSK